MVQASVRCIVFSYLLEELHIASFPLKVFNTYYNIYSSFVFTLDRNESATGTGRSKTFYYYILQSPFGKKGQHSRVLVVLFVCESYPGCRAVGNSHLFDDSQVSWSRSCYFVVSWSQQAPVISIFGYKIQITLLIHLINKQS